jgi:putative toxin-antitoxin system antitoxin component (TIGR02293 family)
MMTVPKPDPVAVEVGRRIRIQRLSSGLSQSSLADRLGVTFQQVQKYEKGVNRVDAGRLAKIAKVLGVPISTFFGSHSAGAADRSDRGTASSPLAMVYRKLGGRQALGEEIASEADLARLVARRIPLRALLHFRRSGFSEGEIERFIIPARTRRHRQVRKQPLTVDESDRVVRLTRIQALAEDVFGDAEKANRWLREGLGILDRKTPLEVAQTDSGARLVEQILAKIDWGAAA